MKNENAMSVPEAARKLGYTLKYVYDLVYSGRLPAKKVAGRWRIEATEIDARISKRASQ